MKHDASHQCTTLSCTVITSVHVPRVYTNESLNNGHFEIGIGALIAIEQTPVINNVLKMVDPTTVPSPTSPAFSVRNIETIDMNKVGADESMAMKVAPATSLSNFKREQI